jgi:glutamate--cysteine ligase
MTDFHASAHAVPIERTDQLTERFHQAGKPRDEWRVGTEYEKPAVDRRTGQAARFSGPRGIETLLRTLAERFGWNPNEEDGRTVALERDGASITLEPGGQVELSGAPWKTLHEADRELRTHVRELLEAARDLDMAFLGLGIQPVSKLEEIEWVPKPRYAIMGPYMTRVGTLGQRMMKQTATVQANLDFADERDAMLKFRTAQGVSPLINALFANSSISEGEPNGFMSMRGHIWTDTDRARSGLLPFGFHDDASFVHYVEWALDVPLYFILRNGRYRTDVTGMPFRRFLSEGAFGERATLDDWDLHLTTLFPEVRLKRFMEIRSADAQTPERVLALPALSKGIFYDADCLGAAWDLVKRIGFEDCAMLYREATRDGLAARWGRIKVLEYSRELYAIADEGLKRQHALDADGQDERRYLRCLKEELDAGQSPAEDALRRWNGEWQQKIGRLIESSELRA